MSDNVLRLDKLTKVYKETKAVTDFDLNVKRGHICGLIGPNGAGKTTIMKMTAGLIHPTSGKMEFFGDSSDLKSSRRRMCFMLEAPIIEPQMTAEENMQYIRYAKGVADEKKIAETLDFVGLGNTGKKLAAKFTLGMKQRLGIAMSLLTEPEILVLDEPVNGLDPEGIVEIRHMLKRLSDEKNVTIIISSHILSELAELCSDFAIINHGRLIESFSASELNNKCRTHIAIKTDNINKTAAVLEDRLSVSDYTVIHGDEIHLYEYTDDIAIVSRTVTGSGLTITKLVSEGESLEDYYLSKVGGENE